MTGDLLTGNVTTLVILGTNPAATATVVDRSHGHLYNSIANGIRSMPAYGHQIPPVDRWAIVTYLRALQRSRNTTIEDVCPKSIDTACADRRMSNLALCRRSAALMQEGWAGRRIRTP